MVDVAHQCNRPSTFNRIFGSSGDAKGGSAPRPSVERMSSGGGCVVAAAGVASEFRANKTLGHLRGRAVSPSHGAAAKPTKADILRTPMLPAYRVLSPRHRKNAPEHGERFDVTDHPGTIRCFNGLQSPPDFTLVECPRAGHSTVLGDNSIQFVGPIPGAPMGHSLITRKTHFPDHESSPNIAVPTQDMEAQDGLVQVVGSRGTFGALAKVAQRKHSPNIHLRTSPASPLLQTSTSENSFFPEAQRQTRKEKVDAVPCAGEACPPGAEDYPVAASAKAPDAHVFSGTNIRRVRGNGVGVGGTSRPATMTFSPPTRWR